MEYKSGAVNPINSIGEGWELIKDDYWNIFLIELVAIIILVVASFIFSGVNQAITVAFSSIMGAATQNSDGIAKTSAAVLPQLISLVISIFTNIIVTTLSGALFCGIYAAFLRKANAGRFDFSDLFSGFQKIMPCLIVAVVTSFIQFVIGIVTLLVGLAAGVSIVGTGGLVTPDGKFNPAMFGGIFLVVIAIIAISFVINLIIGALTTFVYPLLAEHNLSGLEALTLSIKSGFSNLGGLVLLLILLIIMALVGVILCFVGFLFVAPVLTAAIFVAYQNVFGRSRNNYMQTPPPPPNFGY